MKYFFLYGSFISLMILATGCSTINQQSKQKITLTEAQQLEIQMRQVKAISETALDVSKESHKYAQMAYNTSNQANATADTAFQAANNAIKASQQAVESAKESAKQAMDYANKQSQKAIDAANNAISVSNENSAKSIAAANQVMAEMGRIKATVKTVQYEPVLPGRPKVLSSTGSQFGRKYTIKSGDTLSGISLKFYGTANKWRKIYNANRDIIRNPSDLIIGTKIIIPQ
ncbi:MAG: LysM peptidoglycan-binding domain-containing protein [Candidatus Omnitrophica bacterium]|jgi:nucleoid-associated protein YgaU|nr:LysM peptidoglycan-binding domain-containing protein [Candidatus Omnitrophota bacterium]